MGRYAWNISKRSKISVDGAYFKSYGGIDRSFRECSNFDANGNPVCDIIPIYDGFLMEAVSAKLTYTHQILSSYRLNTTLSYFYYFDDRMPFSFRMDPANDDRYTINLTSLHEFRIFKNVFINIEGGFWGLNYKYLYYHGGASINIQNSHGIFGIGASTTISPTFPDDEIRYFAGYDSRYSVHPEIQIQLLF